LRAGLGQRISAALAATLPSRARAGAAAGLRINRAALDQIWRSPRS